MRVIATAGHVDHGKSTLVRALTGTDPDRWAEERRRGLTIDLGYAWTRLPSGAQVAFVDVPGHQRFVTNMLAGVGAVPAVMLVVAADGGWAAQTGEHVAALDALGVRHGVLAVTRADRGDATVTIDRVRDRLAALGSGLAGIEAVAVSGVTGEGLDRLRRALDDMLDGMPEPAPDATRLWVDRVFTVAGAGTVLTGTLASGQIRVGDRLLVSSSGREVTVRGLQSLKAPVSSASAVARVAVNVRGVPREAVRRGDALVAEQRWALQHAIDVRVVGTEDPLPRRLTVHLGSAAHTAQVRMLGAHHARLSMATPLPVHVGDRGVLRDPGRRLVLGGLIVLDPFPPALDRRGAARARGAQLEGRAPRPDVAARLAQCAAVRRTELVAAGELAPDGVPPADVVTAGEWLVTRALWRQWRERLCEATDRWLEERPLSEGAPASDLARRVGLPDAALLGPLLRDTPALSVSGGRVRRAGSQASLPEPARTALDDLLRRLAENPFGAAESGELAAAGLGERELAVAVRAGQLLQVAPGVYLRPDAPERAVRVLRALPQPFTTSQARSALGTTRRVAVPLLEHLDTVGRTSRVDARERVVRDEPGTP